MKSLLVKLKLFLLDSLSLAMQMLGAIGCFMEERINICLSMMRKV